MRSAVVATIFVVVCSGEIVSQTNTSSAKSAIQFRDTTGTAKTAKIGWSGDASNGHFFIQTPGDGELITSKTGGVEIKGTIRAVKLIGDGSELTNVSKPVMAVGDVVGLQDSLGKKERAGGVAALQGVIGGKADTAWVKVKIADVNTPGGGGKADTAWVKTKIAEAGGVSGGKADTAWVKTKIAETGGVSGGKADTAWVKTKIAETGIAGSGKADTAWVKTKIAEAGNNVDSTRVVNGGISGNDVNPGTKLTLGNLLVNGKIGIGTDTSKQKFAILTADPLCATLKGLGSGVSGALHFEHENVAATWNMGIEAGTWATGGVEGTFYIARQDSGPRLAISPLGNIGIGTVNPSEKLGVNGNIRCIALTETSDRRFKSSVTPLLLSLEKVSLLQGVSYQWDRAAFPEHNFPGGTQIGLIAQDVEAVFPEIVSTDAEGYKSLAYDKLVAVLIEAVKEQKLIVEKQQLEITRLCGEISEIKSMIGENR